MGLLVSTMQVRSSIGHLARAKSDKRTEPGDGDRAVSMFLLGLKAGGSWLQGPAPPLRVRPALC